MSDCLKLSLDGNIATIQLNNPPANTWTLESLNLLERIVHELNENPRITALIIGSEEERFFSAGADLKLFADVSPDEARPMAEAFGKAFEALTEFKGISIAAINGFALGGGLEVALACDLRVAEKQAVLGLPEAAVGLLPCAGGTQNLMWLVGEAWTKRMILLGEKVDAESAFRIGLVEELVEQGEAYSTARELAGKVSRQSPDSVVACKKLIQMNRVALRDRNAAERDLFIELFKGQNQNEGVKAFLEKRSPEWVYE
ncbi:enoyl-CoA hydratase [Endozoicomonas numazuensis]|uniref:Enoyl-CoA hydratase n=1 Tax=Endozoicomonas numazuensis TaxID=1137799 RepID=A0A081N134_9GAMM|nr:enoyl-CoA hydratase [Endozoicomonas numazuensis]KEQ12157.1 enoyl-CoA hydratase [Endozoicomonas numazuensis]